RFCTGSLSESPHNMTPPTAPELLGKLRPDLRVEAVTKDGAAHAYRIVDPTSHMQHVLTDVEYAVATEMNGVRTAAEVAQALAARGYTVDASAVSAFHRELEGMSFVVRNAPSSSLASSSSSSSSSSSFASQAPSAASEDRAKAAQLIAKAKQELL